jgi:hypothetical protein
LEVRELREAVLLRRITEFHSNVGALSNSVILSMYPVGPPAMIDVVKGLHGNLATLIEGGSSWRYSRFERHVGDSFSLQVSP